MKCQDCKRELSFKELSKYHIWCRKCYFAQVKVQIFKPVEKWAEMIKVDLKGLKE